MMDMAKGQEQLYAVNDFAFAQSEIDLKRGFIIVVAHIGDPKAFRRQALQCNQMSDLSPPSAP